MKQTIFVKPKAELQLRRPDTKQFLSKDGERVPNNSFWARRLLDGDVVEVEEPKTKDEAPAKAEAEVESASVAENDREATPVKTEFAKRGKGGQA